MTVTVGCEGDGISLGNTANTQYYEKLGAGKTLEVPVDSNTTTCTYDFFFNNSLGKGNGY